jgi:hypothetical protein
MNSDTSTALWIKDPLAILANGAERGIVVQDGRMVIQDGVLRRGVFDNSFGAFIATIPRDADESWLKSEICRVAVTKWLAQIDKRRDVLFRKASEENKERIFLFTHLNPKEVFSNHQDQRFVISAHHFLLQLTQGGA